METRHQQEIKKTRVGGFGSSDAALFYKIGKSGLSALSNTDHERIAVAMGLLEYTPSPTTKAMQAGHEFEDYFQVKYKYEMHPIIFKREYYQSKDLARCFGVFSHFDFYAPNIYEAWELKYSQKTTNEVKETYKYQLQWHYMVGAKAVVLVHGWGGVDPFEPKGMEYVEVAKDDNIIATLMAGVSCLDDAITHGWRPTIKEVETMSDMPSDVRAAYYELQTIKNQKKDLDKRAKAAADLVFNYMELRQIKTLKETAEAKGGISYVSASVTRKFDTDRFLAAHPEFDVDDYYTESKRNATIICKF